MSTGGCGGPTAGPGRRDGASGTGSGQDSRPLRLLPCAEPPSARPARGSPPSRGAGVGGGGPLGPAGPPPGLCSPRRALSPLAGAGPAVQREGRYGVPGTGADGALVPFAQEPTDGCLILSCGESRAGGGTSGRRAGEASSVHRRARATHPPPFRGAQAGGDGTRGALKQTVACRGGARTGRPARHVPKSCVLRSSSQKRSRERPTEPPGKPRNRLCFHLFLPFPGSAEAAPQRRAPVRTVQDPPPHRRALLCAGRPQPASVSRVLSCQALPQRYLLS